MNECMNEFVDNHTDSKTVISRNFSNATKRLKSIKKRLKNGKYINASFNKKSSKYSVEIFYDLVFLNKVVRSLIGKRDSPVSDFGPPALLCAKEIHHEVFSRIYSFALENFMYSDTKISVEAAYSIFCGRASDSKLD